MLYPALFEDKTGFSSIREMLSKRCLCTAGEAYVDNISYSSDHKTIAGLLTELSEMLAILRMDTGFPARDYIDLSQLLVGLQVEGSIVNSDDVFSMKLSFLVLEELRDYFQGERSEKYPALSAIASELPSLSHVNAEISRIIDDKGNIRDKASEELSRIRKATLQLANQSRAKLGQILTQARQAGWTPAGMDLTFRNGRLVIPILATHKRRIKGFVHDASSTEKTVFLEPAEVLDINNELRELEYLEKEEIRRILLAFTNFLRPSIPEILHSYTLLGIFDGVRAKALLAIDLDAVVPILGESSFIEWYDAKHPLLYVSHRRQSKPVIPFDLELRDKHRILVISGPNAGGKSVCLKTVGLLQYMLQCGLAVTTRETSEFGIFEHLFIDIGDEQSIENDLSTYSSHLKNIAAFLESGNARSLFLIDEFGSGTEPQAGAAIAETALEELNNKSSYGVVTTHYTNLKLMAGRTEGMLNGAMLFDTKSMKPLYRLSTGKPGTSFAFEIARSTGLSEDLIQNAIKKAGNTQYEFEQQLQEIEVEKKRIEKKAIELKVADDFLSEMIDKFEKQQEALEKEKSGLKKTAKAEAKRILDDANKLIEKTIREIRESQADKALAKKARATFEKEKEHLIPEEETIREKAKPKKPKAAKPRIIKKEGLPKPGDKVRIKGQKSVAEVVDIDKGIITLLSGNIRLRVSAEQVEKVELLGQKTEKSRQSSDHQKIAKQVNDRLSSFSPIIDIRGVRGEEAISKLEHYIDDAVMLNAVEVRILHGKGDGILRRLVREYLNSRNDISKVIDEHIERGGHGISVVTIRNKLT